MLKTPVKLGKSSPRDLSSAIVSQSWATARLLRHTRVTAIAA